MVEVLVDIPRVSFMKHTSLLVHIVCTWYIPKVVIQTKDILYAFAIIYVFLCRSNNFSNLEKIAYLIFYAALTHWGRNKCTPFRRRHFEMHFFNENVWIPIKISLKLVPKGPINNIPAMVQIMAWRRPGDKPLSEPMMVNLHIYVSLRRSASTS